LEKEYSDNIKKLIGDRAKLDEERKQHKTDVYRQELLMK